MGLGFRWFAGLAAALFFGAPGAAFADEYPASVKGIKLVIPEARGKKADGKTQISGTLRRSMTDALGPLVPSRNLEKAQKTLGQKGAALNEPGALAKAGKEAGAQFVLSVEISKKKWLYTAQAMLINTETGAVQMDFRSQYYKPAAEAGDRGTRIAKRAIEKLAELADKGELPKPIVVADAGDASNEKIDDGDGLKKDPTNEKLEDTPPPPPPPPAASDKVDESPPVSTTGDPPPPPPPPVAPPPPPPPAAIVSAPPPPSSSPSATVVQPVGPEEEEREIFRFTLTGGAGLLRAYGLSSSGVDNSALSFSLVPLSLVATDLELIVPSIPIGILLHGAFRPVKYEPKVLDVPTPTSGRVIDLSGALALYVPLGGSGRQTSLLIPSVGGRFSLGAVDEHVGNPILSANTIATTAGVALRLPFNEVLEVNLGVDGGLILGYSEKPFVTGSDPGGFTIGGDLGARIWLASAVAIAFDNRFTYDRIGFTGSPTRMLPGDELGQLSNATVVLRDLRSSIGIAFRF